MDDITDDEEEPTRTDKYELSQLLADPMTPKLLERRLRRIEWSIVIKGWAEIQRMK